MYTLGECVLIETNTYQDGRPKAHLFVVLFPAYKDSDLTIVVPISSIRPGIVNDGTTLLDRGDHDFIKHPSFADYGHALIKSKQQLDNEIAEYRARRRPPPMKHELVLRLRRGINVSGETPNAVVDLAWKLLTGK